MDDLDMRMLRALFNGRSWHFVDWDPRVSIQGIAARAGIGRTTVWERLKTWEERGFLRGYGVLLNPALFGVRMAALNVRIADRGAKEGFLDALREVPDVAVILDHVGSATGIGVVFDDPMGLMARKDALAGLDGVGHVEPGPFLPHHPLGGKPMTDLDWRILRALCAWDGRTLDPVAAEVGVSVRTVRRHYERLIAARAVWFNPQIDFSKTNGVLVLFAVSFDPVRSSLAEVAAEMRGAFPDVLQLGDRFETATGETLPLWQGFVHVESAAAAEDAVQVALTLPGVVDVEVAFPRRNETLNHWCIERIGARPTLATDG